MVDWYWDRLVKQFQRATNVKKTDPNSKYFLKEFSGWLKAQKKAADLYIQLLSDIGIDINEAGVMEIGKGEYDTLISKESPAQILTPYASSFDNRKNVKSGHLVISEKGPMALYEDQNTITNQPNYARSKIVYLGDVERFATQNPYLLSSLASWEKLHNQGNNICVGVYGCETDADYHDKIKQINNLRSLIKDKDVYEESTTIGTSYAYTVASSRENLKT